jgi:hypothetical protein
MCRGVIPERRRAPNFFPKIVRSCTSSVIGWVVIAAPEFEDQRRNAGRIETPMIAKALRSRHWAWDRVGSER